MVLNDSTRSSRLSLSRKLASYALAAGAGLASAPKAEAGIIPWTPDGGDPIIVHSGEAVRIDLDRDGFIDYVIDGTIFNDLGALFLTIGAITDSVQNLVLGSAHVYASWLPIGSAIGPVDNEHWHPAHKLVYGLTRPPVGEFVDRRGWTGLYFEIPGGSQHYAYLDVEGAANQITIYGGGYESQADTPIQAAVPEPSTLALWAIGAAGILAWRARRGQRTIVPSVV